MAEAPFFTCLETPSSSEPDTDAFPITVTDSNGRQLTLDRPTQAMVILSPAHVEILFALGAGGDIAAVDENSDCPQETAQKTKLSGFTPNLEAIAAETPDLVLIFYDPGDLQASLERLDIPVLFLATADSVEGVYDQIRLLGQVTGRSQRAAEVVASMQDRVVAVQEKLADVQQGPRVFHEIDPGLFTTCPGEFIHDMYHLLKAQNIATQPGIPCQLSHEAIIEAGPEVIILADEPAGVTVESVKARPGWGGIPAVANDRVFIVDIDIVSRPGPRIVDALEALARLLYPERFP
jgi:iron complex transport system substrate-binding protein